MRIYLVGMMGSGKTTIGKKLAKRLLYNFYDLDELIEKREGITISTIFEQKGEEYFRHIEQQVLRETFKFGNTVISTGGGTPCFFDNINEINRNGVSIYLNTDIDLLMSRLVSGIKHRPLLKNKTNEELKEYLENLLSQRILHYKKAHLIFNAKDITTDKLLEVLVSKS
ncbi:MAG: shikimate kinase [Bacteroidales bacterium]